MSATRCRFPARKRHVGVSCGSLEEGAIDPDIILDFNEAVKVKEDLANQDSWSKYLNEKPGLKDLVFGKS